MTRMLRHAISNASAIAAGLLLGLALWGLVLGVQVRRHEPGLWTVRSERLMACGLDYNGPPFDSGGAKVWLTCGAEDRSWRLWPPDR